MKNVLKKLIAVVLAVTTLTMLFCISSNAVTNLYNNTFFSGGQETLTVSLNAITSSYPNPTLRADLQIKNLSTYNTAVFACGMIGYYYGTSVLYNTYTGIYNAYNSKLFGDDRFLISHDLTLYNYTDVEPGVVASFGGISFIAGKQSSSYSSTYNCRYVEIDPVTQLPVYTTYFSEISGDCLVYPWP